jgi:hypothetical protein
MTAANTNRAHRPTNGTAQPAQSKAASPKAPAPSTAQMRADLEDRKQALKDRLQQNRNRRARSDEDDPPEPEPAKVSAGAVEKVIDLTFNPTRDKIREVTVIDRMQGRWFPQLDMINSLRKYCQEIAFFRQSPTLYKSVFKKVCPVSPDALEELLYRTAQWQKSVSGKNLDRAIDIALAETEAHAGDEDSGMGGGDAWKE